MIRRLAPSSVLLPSAAAFLGAHARFVFQSKEFLGACKDLPKTPSGKNPYDVLEVTVTKSTTLEDLSKQFREMVIRHHPDKPGGSTDKMSELNTAFGIIKEHHAKVLRAMDEVEVQTKANEAYRQHRHARADRDDELGRSGGVRRRNVRAMNQAASAGMSSSRSQKEIEQQWETMRSDSEAAVQSMCNRYEVAIEQAIFFRKSSMVNEITVRERWLRKSFIKGLWEDVHELRGELLRRRSRNAQQSQLAEEMVSFAGVIQRKLNDDFQLRTQKSVQAQSRMFVQRACMIMFFLVCFLKFWRWLLTATFSNSLTVRFKSAMLG